MVAVRPQRPSRCQSGKTLCLRVLRTLRDQLPSRFSASASATVLRHSDKNSTSRMDNELLRVWQLISELSEQLAANQKITSNLLSQAGNLKVSILIIYPACNPSTNTEQNQASDTASGFTLRRFNTDISKGAAITLGVTLRAHLLQRPLNLS